MSKHGGNHTRLKPKKIKELKNSINIVTKHALDRYKEWYFDLLIGVTDEDINKRLMHHFRMCTKGIKYGNMIWLRTQKHKFLVKDTSIITFLPQARSFATNKYAKKRS